MKEIIILMLLYLNHFTQTKVLYPRPRCNSWGEASLSNAKNLNNKLKESCVI